MAEVIVDNFNRANTTATGPGGAALGTTSDGKRAWVIVNGQWRINSNQAQVSTSAVNTLATIEAQTPNMDVQARLGGSDTNNCLYFRVVDANNWWRVRIHLTSSTSSQDVYITEYQWTHTFVYEGNDGGIPNHTHSYWCSSGTSTCAPIWCGHTRTDTSTGGIAGWSRWGGSVTNTRQVYSHTNHFTTYFYHLQLQRMVDGVLTTTNTWSSTTSTTALNFVRVHAEGGTIQVFSGSSAPAATLRITRTEETTHMAGTRVGMGRSTGTGYTDDFQVEQLIGPPPIPTPTSPVAGHVVDRQFPIKLQWETENQLFYSVRYRRVGTETWTTVSDVESGDMEHVIAANTFTQWGTYEWQARATGEFDLMSEWSPSAQFVVSFISFALGSEPVKVVRPGYFKGYATPQAQ